MDPTVAWNELVEAYAEGNREACIEHGGNLLAWIKRGGFSPDGFDRDLFHRMMDCVYDRRYAECVW